MPQDPVEFDELPEPLAADLHRLYRADVAPSPAVDQALLHRARAHLAGRKRVLLLRRVAGAAAAVILVAAALVPFIIENGQGDRAAVVHRAEDVTGDGVVDIRDAMALQRRIEAGQAGRDVTGDGVTDKRDVDAIAMMVVRLHAGVAR